MVAVSAQYHMQFDHEVVAGFLNYTAAQTDWTVDISNWNSGVALRTDCDGYLLRGAVPARSLPKPHLRRSVLVTGEDDLPCPRVWVDDSELGRIAASHLLALAPSSFLSVSPLGIAAFARRDASFAESVSSSGVEVRTADISRALPKKFDPEKERKRIVAAVRKLPTPIGVMCPDAGIAYRVFDALHSIGYTVPDDAMVVACEDDEVAALACRPQLSAIDCRGRAVGYEAAALLHRLLEGDSSIVARHRKWVAPGPLARRASTQPARTKDTAIRAALEFMRKRLAEPISVKDIAAHVNLSRRTLERLFRRETGRSPAADLLSMRLELASQLLDGSPMRIAEVSLRCGFRSVTHFNNQFRKRYHCTPSEYRMRRISGVADRRR